MSDNPLSFEEKHYIEIELKSGTSKATIAKAPGRNYTTIKREITLNVCV
jgi:IS30 family transposase